VIMSKVVIEKTWLAAVGSAIGGSIERLERFKRIMQLQKESLMFREENAKFETDFKEFIPMVGGPVSEELEVHQNPTGERFNILWVNVTITLIVLALVTICTMKMLN